MLITRRALRSFRRGTARPIKVVWGFNGWDRCRESDYAKAPRLVYSCCKQLSCGCCANARSLQIREGVRAGPGRLRAAEEFEQRLRLRSRALSFRHHRCPPSHTESQRLSYCGEDIRRYGERSEPTTPLTPRYLNTARRSNTLTQRTVGIKAKVENQMQYDEYLKELQPIREELGVNLKEGMYPEAS